MDSFYMFLKLGIPFEFIAAVIIVLIAGCILLWRGSKPKEWYYLLLLLAYFVLVLGKTVIFRKAGEVEEANTYPFWSYVEGFTKRSYVLVQNLLNILLFLPIGIFLGGIFKTKRFLKVTLSGAALSLIIELLQLAFEKGLCEFDDIFHNTLGAIFGLLILDAIRRLGTGKSKASSVVDDGN